MSTATLSTRPAQASVKANLTRSTLAQQPAPRPMSTTKRPSFLDLLMRALGAVNV
jgi:hypothetical protein